jgi:heme oxygenase
VLPPVDLPTNPPQTLSPLEVIRQRTRPLHARLDASIDLSGALTSRESYSRLLLRYLSVYIPFEQAVATHSKETLNLINWPRRSKIPLLQRDLRALGSVEDPPPSPSLPSLDNQDALLGALYVVEGSALGGQIIYRQIEQKLHLTPASGAAFFFGDGDQTGSLWKQFTAFLDHHITRPKRAADAAAAMFHAFEQALASPKEEQPAS